MNPIEKAKELVDKFTTFHFCGSGKGLHPDIWTAKKNALICVEEILKAYPCVDEVDRIEIEYWNNVKKAIEQL